MITYKIRKSILSSLVLVLILGFYPVPANAFDIFFGTDERGTFSHFCGRLVERVVNREMKDINCTAVSGSGGIHNLTNLLQGSLDIALIDSRMLHDAVNKTGNFEFLDINYQNLSILAPFYDMPVILVTGNKPSITTLDDLKGKRINIGAPLSSQNLLFETIMRTKTWSKNDFSLVAEISASQSQDTMAFCHGTIDAMIHIGVHPDPKLEQLLKLCNAKTINLDDNDIAALVDQHPAFSKFTLLSGTYPSQAEDILTFGTQVLMVASQDLDEETVYTILDGIYKNREKLSHSHPALALKKIKKETLAGIKLHPGALKYFSEQ